MMVVRAPEPGPPAPVLEAIATAEVPLTMPDEPFARISLIPISITGNDLAGWRRTWISRPLSPAEMPGRDDRRRRSSGMKSVDGVGVYR